MKRLLILVLFSLVSKIEVDGNVQLIGRQYQKTASDVVEYMNRMRSRSHSNFIVGFPDNPILTTIQVGTPPKNFTVSIETGTDDLWLLDPKYPGIGVNQSAYDVNASTSGKQEDGKFEEISEDRGLYGNLFTDSINVFLGPFAQTFGTVQGSNATDWDNPEFEFEGVLGLEWKPNSIKNVNSSSSPILNILAQLPSSTPKFYVTWLQSKTIQDVGRYHDFIVTFGSIPTDKCDASNFNFAPLTFNPQSEILSFVVDEFYVGSYTNLTAMPAKVDTGLPLILAPYDQWLGIYYEIDPDYSWELNLYVVTCHAVHMFPDWIFKINGITYTIPPTSYIVDLLLGDGSCAVMFNLADGYIVSGWGLGTPFLWNYCEYFDVDNQQIGFARALTDTSTGK
ncbi:Peptidase A1 domain-containing protein [Aphelenchoides besseyi]|nr:Peptidase A1 domain-containing protein [Aphelenchoides besseyi]